jgi:hypothetical protein
VFDIPVMSSCWTRYSRCSSWTWDSMIS